MRKYYQGYSYPVNLERPYSNSSVVISHRKTKDYSLSSILPGEVPPLKKIALCLPEEDPTGEPFWTRVPLHQIYVKAYKQDKLSQDLDPIRDYRNLHIDLWSQCNKNLKNPEIRMFQPTYTIMKTMNAVDLEYFYE